MHENRKIILTGLSMNEKEGYFSTLISGRVILHFVSLKG